MRCTHERCGYLRPEGFHALIRPLTRQNRAAAAANLLCMWIPFLGRRRTLGSLSGFGRGCRSAVVPVCLPGNVSHTNSHWTKRVASASALGTAHWSLTPQMARTHGTHGTHAAEPSRLAANAPACAQRVYREWFAVVCWRRNQKR